MTLELSTTEPDNGDEHSAHPMVDKNAEVTELFPPDFREIDPSEFDDDEFIDLVTSSWMHPSVRADKLAETISSWAVRDDDNPWHKRFVRIMDTSPFFEIYAEALNDPVFADIVTFLQTTKKRREEYEHQRDAAMALAEICSVILSKKQDSSNIGRVFAKMPHEVN